MLCTPVWRWFTEAAWAAGQIPTPDVPVENGVDDGDPRDGPATGPSRRASTAPSEPPPEGAAEETVPACRAAA